VFLRNDARTTLAKGSCTHTVADYVQFETDVISCEKATSAFAHFSRGMLNNCVCPVDGNVTLIRYIILYIPL
jgi:hypothetical protein